MQVYTFVAGMIVAVACALQAVAGSPAIEATQNRDEWFRDRLLQCQLNPPPAGTAEAQQPEPRGIGLEVLANNDPVQSNGRGGKPLKLGKIEYTHGLYCHAVSKVVVRLPGPARTFSATIGVDSNSQTSGGRGSVVFAVVLKDKAAFQSAVMRENSPSRRIDVDLAGANTFTLEVGDAGDGIACDQADWADAKVTLADHREISLGDMPLQDHRPASQSIESLRRTSRLPFAFLYAGQTSDDLLASWPKKTDSKKLDGACTQHVLVWTDPKTGMEARCAAVEYADFPACEWTVYFKNTGRQKSPILENVRALDATIQRQQEGEFVLRHWRGDTCSPNLYEPLTEILTPQANVRFAPAGGRSCNGAFPYYNLQMPGGGVMLAVGWPGQWATTFLRDAQRGLRIAAGQEFTHLSLNPGEEIRTPLIAMLFWQGSDTVRAQNLWRRWMIAHNLPRTADAGLPPPSLFGNTSLEFNEMCNANEENQKQFIDRYREERVKIDFWWMDAGWYPCNGQWWNTGTWEPDKVRFPGGLRAISDHARNSGVKTLVWFEPERVAGGTWLSKHHPQWLLGPLLNLGDTGARNWLTDHVDRVLTEQGIGLYRQDFNMDPLDCWRNNDAPDRQGITENLHVQGYLAYWDELRRRHPSLIIDSCASGGRRNDLETMRRAVPLHPTDYNYADLAVKQAYHSSLCQWIPYFGSNTVPVGTVDPYAIRSGYGMSTVLGYDLRNKDLDYDLLRKLAEEWRRIVPCFYGDYYPLTPYSVAEDKWIAWQFNRPEQGDGIVQAFRRTKNEEPVNLLRLGGLAPDASYEVIDLDAKAPKKMTGKEMMSQGLPVEIKAKRGAVVIAYKKVKM